MSVCYNRDFKIEVVKAYMIGDKLTAQLAVEYNITKSTIAEWAKKYDEDEECQYKNTTAKINESDSAREIRRLNQILKEKEKKIEFLKKSVAFFVKEID